MHHSPVLATRAVHLPLRIRLSRAPSWLAALTLLVLFTVLGPAGYQGAGGDDWHYLEAARCAATHGLCLPQTHWAARLPLILPMAAAIAEFGIAAWSVALVPFLYSCAAIILFALNVERRFGRPAAALASAAFVLTPAIFLPAAQPLVDLPELAWVLAGLLAAQIAIERGAWNAAALGGMALALAVMTRMSALALLPVAGLGWAMLPTRLRGLALPAGVAFGTTLAVEAIGYWLATGDPAYGWRLSLNHTRIPTTELPPGIDLSRSALFNLDLIDGWRRSMGIHVHWTVDPLLNLIADPLCGLTLIGATVLAAMAHREWRETRWITPIVVAAALHFMILTYVLAVDPKPRMFAFEYAVAATLIGVFGLGAWRNGRRALPIAVLTLIALRAGVMAADRIDLRDSQRTAAEWIALAPGGLAIDDWTRRGMALDPAAYALPVATNATYMPIIILTPHSCEAMAATRGSGWRVARAQRFEPRDPPIITRLRARAVLFGPREVATLCVVSPASGPVRQPPHGASRSPPARG